MTGLRLLAWTHEKSSDALVHQLREFRLAERNEHESQCLQEAYGHLRLVEKDIVAATEFGPLEDPRTAAVFQSAVEKCAVDLVFAVDDNGLVLKRSIPENVHKAFSE